MEKRQTYPLALQGLRHETGDGGLHAFWGPQATPDPQLLRALPDYADPQLQPGQTLLKQARQRFVLRHPTQDGSVVIKLFPLKSVVSRLKHPKYAYTEFANMCMARDRGVPVPDPIAFLETRRAGLVRCSGLIQQDLAGHVDLLTLSKDAGLPYLEVARHATRALKMLFDAGVNHIDLRDENIMVAPDSGDLQIIDWQYARFGPAREPWLLEYLTAYFIRLAPEEERDMLNRDWVPQVHAECAHPDKPATFKARVAALVGRRAKVAQRMALRPVQMAVS